MKVLTLNNHFNIGGITTYILNLTKGLTELGLKVYLASSGGNALNNLNYEHIKIPLRTKSELSPKVYLSYLKLKPLLKEINLIHASTRLTRVLAQRLSFKGGIPYISTVHGYHKPKIKNLIFPCWGKKIIAVSKFVKNHLISDFKIPAEKIEVIYNGLDFSFFKDFKVDAEKLKIDHGFKDKFLIITLSRLSDVKGLQCLLKAFKLFSEKYQDVLLLIAGGGRERNRIQDLTRKLSLTQRVKLLGVLKDVRPLLKMADIFVQPSLMEGLGFSILEALAMRKPIIASKTGGIPEIVKDGYNGILVPQDALDSLAEALVKLREDQNLRHVLIQNAERTLEGFDYKQMAQKTYEVYEKVLKG